MKNFMILAMIVALLVTAWLVVRSMSDVSTGKPAAVQSVQRADEARQKVERTNEELEKKLDSLGKE